MAFRHSFGATLAVAPLLMGSLHAAHAQTCTPGLYVAVAAPRDGEVNVPTNAVIDIRVAGDPVPSTILSEFGLRQPPSGPPIPVSVSSRLPHAAPYIWPIRLTPVGFLNPGQMYQVVRNIAGDAGVLETFTTGSGPDFTIPPAPSGASATVDTFDLHPDGGSDCIRDRIRQVRLTLPDAGKPVVYLIQENGQTLSTDEPSSVGIFNCSSQPQWQGDVSWVVAPGLHTIQLSAVDRAGNASPSVDVSFNADCAIGSTGDGGSPGPGGTVPPGGRPVDSIAGCSCQNGTIGALALGGFALILRARQRKNRR